MQLAQHTRPTISAPRAFSVGNGPEVREQFAGPSSRSITANIPPWGWSSRASAAPCGRAIPEEVRRDRFPGIDALTHPVQP